MYKLLVSLLLFTSLNSFARSSLDDATKTQVQAVFEANESLHAAFFSYDAAEVQKAAKNVADKISGVKKSEIAKLLTYSAKKLNEITADKDEKANKEAYGVVSLALANIINKYDVGEKWNVYSCPMVKKKWIQNSAKKDEVANPYAASMPTCGSKDTNY